MQLLYEPLYGHYLRVTGAPHPGREDVLAAMNCDGDAVMRELLAKQQAMTSRRLFIKHMAHHLVDIDIGFLRQTTNIFLIRDPREMLPSLTVQVPDAGGLSDSATVTVTLNDVNEQPTVNDDTFSVDENSPDGTSVGSVTAGDPDAGDTLDKLGQRHCALGNHGTSRAAA